MCFLFILFLYKTQKLPLNTRHHHDRLQGISKQILKGQAGTLGRIQWLSIYSDTKSSNNLTERGNRMDLLITFLQVTEKKKIANWVVQLSTTLLQINQKKSLT